MKTVHLSCQRLVSRLVFKGIALVCEHLFSIRHFSWVAFELADDGLAGVKSMRVSITMTPLEQINMTPLGQITTNPLGQITMTPLGQIITNALGQITMPPLGQTTGHGTKPQASRWHWKTSTVKRGHHTDGWPWRIRLCPDISPESVFCSDSTKVGWDYNQITRSYTHVKDAVVYVRLLWIMEALKNQTCTKRPDERTPFR